MTRSSLAGDEKAEDKLHRGGNRTKAMRALTFFAASTYLRIKVMSFGLDPALATADRGKLEEPRQRRNLAPITRFVLKTP